MSNVRIDTATTRPVKSKMYGGPCSMAQSPRIVRDARSLAGADVIGLKHPVECRRGTELILVDTLRGQLFVTATGPTKARKSSAAFTWGMRPWLGRVPRALPLLEDRAPRPVCQLLGAQGFVDRRFFDQF